MDATREIMARVAALLPPSYRGAYADNGIRRRTHNGAQAAHRLPYSHSNGYPRIEGSPNDPEPNP